MKKRLLALLLVFVLAVSLLPGAAFAAEVVDSGTCGDNLTWTLNDEGTLTISGTGNMRNYSNTEVPWYSVRKNIKSVVIAEGVTSIGDCAFYGCSTPTSITIPDSVTSIGRDAFEYCSSLTSVTIPSSVKSIGNYAFSNCSSLTSVTIPSSVTSIGEGTFWYCSSLTSITIPNSVESIGQYAFYYCSNLTSVTISEGVKSIGKSAFYGCSSLTSISIPNSVTSIGELAFYYCRSLTNITIPSSVTSIGRDAFEYCSSLTSVTISEGVKSIGKSAFSGCSSLTSISIPSSVKSIGEWTFSSCSSLTSITIPNSVTSIGYGTFMYCYSLTSITIPDSVTSIGELAFYYCSSLTSINVDSSNNFYKSVDGVLFTKDGKTLVVYPADHSGSSYSIPESVTSIGRCAFSSCRSLTNVTIPSSVPSIGVHAFAGCSSLTSITIPSSVTSIGEYAFAGCSSLTSITIPSSVESIGKSAFYGCSSLTSISIPSSVPSIGEGAFRDCSSLTSISIPSSVKIIDNYAFDGCSSLTSISIPSSVKIIDNYAFRGCSSLASVSIPDSVTRIGTGAFDGCSKLTKINYGGNSDKWNSISSASVPSGATVLYNCAETGEFHFSSNTPMNCITKNSAIDIYAGYYVNGSLTGRGCLVTVEDTDVLQVQNLGWDNNLGQHLMLTAKKAGSTTLEVVDSSTGATDSLEINVVDSAAVFSFDNVPQMTIEVGKTTNFYNYSGMVVDNFEYYEVKDANGAVDHYNVTMTVYNTLDIYGAITSYDADGHIFDYCVIDKFTTMDSSFVETIESLINSTGDLFYLYDNSKFYSGESISKKTEINGSNPIKVPVGGYLEISNNASSPVALVANIAGSIIDIMATAKSLGGSGGELFASKGLIVNNLLKDAFTKDYAGKKLEKTIKKLVKKELKNGNWNLLSYGDGIKALLDALEQTGFDFMELLGKEICSVKGLASIAESVSMDVIPTGPLINASYGFMDFLEIIIEAAQLADSVDYPMGIYLHTPAVVTITAQPENSECTIGEKAVFAVETAEDGLKYQWYYRNPGRAVFTAHKGETNSTYSIEMTSARNGREMYCVITDAYGMSVTTDIVTMTIPVVSLEITAQPQNVACAVGETAQFTVEATGEGLTYQWYYKNPGKAIFTPHKGQTANTYSLEMTEARNGREMYCIITNKNGDRVQTETVTMTVPPPITITEQPGNVFCIIGETAVFTVEAEGENLTYQWYYKNPTGTNFNKVSGATQTSYSIKMTAARDGRQMYCVVKDGEGHKLRTAVVTMRTSNVW